MTTGARILIVEDNPANLELMVYLLRASGYPTLTAADGAAGLALARSELPDLILCDVRMPVMDGHEMAQRVRQCAELSATPLIAVTAFARDSDRDRALASGFDGYMSKPIDPVTFVHQVESFLVRELRRRAPDPIAGVAPSAKQSPGSGPRILVLDNLQAHLDLASSLLEPSGYNVITALDAKQALLLARETLPDLILSDVCMPEGSGFDFIRDVKADPRLAAIPFVFISSTMATEAARRRGLALGAAKFLFRPMEPEQVLMEINDCLGNRGRP